LSLSADSTCNYQKSQDEHFAKLIAQARASGKGKPHDQGTTSEKPIEISSDIEMDPERTGPTPTVVDQPA
jgi:hypothetical protein